MTSSLPLSDTPTEMTGQPSLNSLSMCDTRANNRSMILVKTANMKLSSNGLLLAEVEMVQKK